LLISKVWLYVKTETYNTFGLRGPSWPWQMASEKTGPMEPVKLLVHPDEDQTLIKEGEFSRSELIQQLERIVSSKHFRNSKRYPSFLRFVVEQTLAGKTEELKERTLGASVFDRRNDYDTNADPIVRVTAGEIRKRIAQYYQEPGHEDELRIDLPLGSYVPHFFPAARAAQAEHERKRDQLELLNASASVLEYGAEESEVGELHNPKRAVRSRRLKIVLLMGTLSVIAGIAILVGFHLRNRPREQGIDYFWAPVTTSSNPALIVIGVHSLNRRGQDMPAEVHANSGRNEQESMLSSMISSDMVPVSDIVSYSRVTDLLTRRSHVYQTKGSADTSLEDLRHGPVILIGGLDNVWTKRLTATLRYSFFASTQSVSEIRDNKNLAVSWRFDNLQRASANSRDFAIVASYFDPTIEQHVLIVAGIGKTGTVAASEFMTSNQHLSNWLAEAKVPAGKNIELVLSTDILDGQPGPPHVLASSVW